MARLEILAGQLRDTVIEITGETQLGRSPDSTVCLADSRVSRHHAVIRSQDDYYVLEDLGSSNGTWLNGERLPPGERPLYAADQIVIGNTRMLFQCDRNEQPPPALGATEVMEVGANEDLGSLAVVITGDSQADMGVNAALDASGSMVELRAEERASLKTMERAVKRLQAMIGVSQAVGAVTEKSAVLDKIMASIFDVFPQADRAFVLLANRETGDMEFASGRHRNARAGQQAKAAISRTIVNTVVKKRQAVLSSDAMEDFDSRSIVNLSIRAMMCAPFIWQDEILGVISVDTMSALHSFTSDDLLMLSSIAGQAAMAIKNADLYTEVQQETKRRTVLSRYMSPDVVQGVLDGLIPLELGGKKARGTVLFADIVGFTRMSERLAPMEIVSKLNRYFAVTTDIVSRNGGTVHKFQGDMIMAFWNVLFPDGRAALNSILTSLQMQVAVWSFNLALEREGGEPVYLGIGCNTGEFVAGNVGGEDRFEYTVIGDNVNLASRIEGLAGRWQVFVSASTFELAGDLCAAVALPEVTVKGKSESVQVYSVRGIRTKDDEMFLDIPVVFGEDRDTRGILVATRGVGNERRLILRTEHRFEPGQRIVLHFDIPELATQLSLTATVDAVTPHSEVAGDDHFEILLSAMEGDDALRLLRAGTRLESGKDWDDLERA